MVEDNKGFLWIATDNGLSRFDGKYFQHFSVRQGLPSNEVLQVLKDGDGNIWANCYKQSPAYFDQINGIFVSVKNHPHLNNISKSLLAVTHLSDGAIKFHNHTGYVTFKNKQITDYSTQLGDRIQINNKIIDIRLKNKDQRTSINYLFSDGKLIDSIIIRSDYDFAKSYFTGNAIYHFTGGNKIYQITIKNIQPLSYKVSEITIPEHIAWYKIIAANLVITSTEGNVYIYNKDNLTLTTQITGTIKANCAYVDRFNNIWTGSLDEGLAYYDNNKIRTIAIAPGYVNPNFLSLAINDRNELFAGNYYGQVLILKNNQPGRYEHQDKNYQTWIRKLICIGSKVIMVNDRGYSINFGPFQKVLNANKQATLLKDAIQLNDSTIVFGTIAGLISLNLHTGQTKSLSSNHDRALSLVASDGEQLYYISTNGLYRYSISKDSSVFIPLNKAFNYENLAVLTYAGDRTLWAGTLSGNILVFKNDTIYARVKEDVSIPGNITCMLAHQNKIWIGGKTGVAILTYSFLGGRLQYKINTISKNDGLPSNSINSLVATDDTVYVVTENGIAVVPANYESPKFEISPELTGIRINQVSAPIAQSYQLESNQNDIMLQLAGIELSGHFKAIQYRLNDNLHWSPLEGNALNIRLSSGRHTIYIRAIDANNRISQSQLKLDFHIKTPFYQSIWFWSLVAILVTASIFWWLNWIRLQRQKTLYDRQLALDLQRKKIMADLHDDIGATLSALQLNSAVANQLINTDAERARGMLLKVEDQAQNLAEKIGDIIWSMKPADEEFMTIGSRIKNFAHDILGSGQMEYKIMIAPEVSQLLTDITMRKNIVLITKEAINNIAKYSQATSALVSIEKKGNQFQLSIRDNGIGFDPGLRKGNGLANMRIRAEELKGSFSIDTAVGKGTSILVLIPALP